MNTRYQQKDHSKELPTSSFSVIQRKSIVPEFFVTLIAMGQKMLQNAIEKGKTRDLCLAECTEREQKRKRQNPNI